MTDGYLLNLRAFREVRDDKAQAPKPLEEAAEAFGAWQECDDMRFSPIMTARRAYRDDLIDECLDTAQATVNLLAAVAFALCALAGASPACGCALCAAAVGLMAIAVSYGEAEGAYRLLAGMYR